MPELKIHRTRANLAGCSISLFRKEKINAEAKPKMSDASTWPILHFSRDEYAARISKTRKEMTAREVDVIIVTDPSNMCWLTGYDGWSFYVPQCVALALDGGPIWFGRAQDSRGAARTSIVAADDIIGYADHYVQSTQRHAMEYLAQIIAERGWSTHRIGVEMDNYWFSAAGYARLAANLPNAQFVDITNLVNWQRAIKSPQEIACMRHAAKLVERMHARVLEKVEPGVRKCDLVADIYDAALRYDADTGVGGEYPAIVPLLGSGADAAASHLTWDDKPMRAGEGTFFELVGVYHRYHCPLSRTIFLGKPPAAFVKAESAIVEGLEAGLEVARAGNLCEEVADAFFAALAKHGIIKSERVGYPVGLSYPPDWGERTMSFRPGDKSVLRENMTFHFMAAQWMGDWGFELTESVIIGKGAPECLTNVPRKLFVKT